jgi:signal transduction histidine kinase
MKIADFLRERCDEIVDRWETKVREGCTEGGTAVGKTLPPPVLRNHMPDIIRQIAKFIEADTETDLREGALTHVIYRIRIGADLREVVNEYLLLRSVIVDFVDRTFIEASADDPERFLHDKKRMHSAIDLSVQEAVAQYHETRMRDLETFMHMISHDLRNPLNVASIATGNILRSPMVGEPIRKMVSRIGNATNRMAALVDQLVELARARSGNFKIARTNLDIGEITAEYVADAELAHPEKQALDSGSTSPSSSSMLTGVRSRQRRPAVASRSSSRYRAGKVSCAKAKIAS